MVADCLKMAMRRGLVGPRRGSECPHSFLDSRYKTHTSMALDKDVLDIDPAAETDRIVGQLRTAVHKTLRRRGAVLGISGGVDSSVVLALCVRAFGPERVQALMLPERDSESDSARLAQELAAQYGVTPIEENITPALEGFGCYERRDAAIRRVFPEYDTGYEAKLVLADGNARKRRLNVYELTIVTPEGEERSKRLAPSDFLQIMAASNMKQRTRMTFLYYHAERRHYAVVGTANKDEHGQGFFVKHGDGGVDVQPIAHLFKTQVYQLAEYVGVPEEIYNRPSTSDTYSATQTQEEFFFRLPFGTLDLIWYAWEHKVPAEDVAPALDLSVREVEHAFDDLSRKTQTTAYLRQPPITFNART